MLKKIGPIPYVVLTYNGYIKISMILFDRVFHSPSFPNFWRVKNAIKRAGSLLTLLFFRFLNCLGIRFINIYRVEQQYGGPEEGGWYFNRYNCLYSIITFYPFAKSHQNIVARKFKQKGNIGKLIGGRVDDLDSIDDFDPNDGYGLDFDHDVEVCLENKPAERSQFHRPRYE